MIRVAVAFGLAVVALGGLLSGPTAFTVVVVVLAAVVLVDLSLLLAAGGARPVLPVALVPGVVLPALVAVDVARNPAAGWDRVPEAFAVAFLLGFVLVLVFGRRGGAVVGLSATAMVSLLVGLGATSLLLLRGLPDGLRWVLALGVLVGAADCAAPAVRALRRRAGHHDDELGVEGDRVAAPLDGVVPALVAVALVAGVLAVVMGEPLDPLTVALLAVVAVVAALGGAYLQRALSTEAGIDPDEAGARMGEGTLFSAADAMMLAAPAAYVVVRSVVL